jgi:hypothetical protein
MQTLTTTKVKPIKYQVLPIEDVEDPAAENYREAVKREESLSMSSSKELSSVFVSKCFSLKVF